MRQRYSVGYRRKKRSIWPKFLIFLLALGAAGYFVYTSEKFERVKPTITAPKVAYAGAKNPLKIVIEDNQALGQYQAVFSDGSRNIIAASGGFDTTMTKTEISISFPSQLEDDKQGNKWKLTIIVKDKSLWNYIGDNIAIKTIDIIADTKPPKLSVLAKSATMARGGSALIVFSAEDVNLNETYVVSGGIKFSATEYKKKGYYATLIAWPFKKKRIEIFVIATDIAGNKASKKVTFPKVLRKYKVSEIVVSDRFLDGKIAEVASGDPRTSRIKSRIRRFKAVNETMRIANEKLIHSLTKKVTHEKNENWKVRAFYPLKSAKLVADFGDKRHYFYKNKSRKISQSYHLGYDFASTKHAPIISSNNGKVVFASENGIYGKMPIIDHGFGLYTLYGHCSRILVEEGEEVEAGQAIAKTGATGLALGDHLHFGVLIQGVEVWPMDWIKQNWIKNNIDKVFRKADRIIGKK
ncbi:MAG: M23 family metallopeptidase [Sulfurovum sp.]|nr:M23 family metallopeptidase [Sulfurovum sp.]